MVGLRLKLVLTTNELGWRNPVSGLFSTKSGECVEQMHENVTSLVEFTYYIIFVDRRRQKLSLFKLQNSNAGLISDQRYRTDPDAGMLV
jgi:hypothetical protein